MASSETTQFFLDRIAALTPADLSVLEAALRTPPGDTATLMTTASSANDVLWSRMVDQAWMRRSQPKEPQHLSGIPVELRLYELTEFGRTELVVLLEKKTRYAAMDRVLQELCVPFGDELWKRTQEGNGKMGDFFNLLEHTIVAILNRRVVPEYRRTVVDDIAQGVHRRLDRIEAARKQSSTH